MLNHDKPTHQSGVNFTNDRKIPWHESEFSRRMLALHLSQGHDLASRRNELITRQCKWLEKFAAKSKVRILDLGCGPGLYSNHLCKDGHQLTGIDFSPASIEYARTNAPAINPPKFILRDLREGEYGSGYDLALFLYAEYNAFSADDAALILRHIHEALAPEAPLLLEIQNQSSVKAAASNPASNDHLETGLFSDQPHTLTTKSAWDESSCSLRQTFTISSEHGDKSYAHITRAISASTLRAELLAACFCQVKIEADWPSGNPDLELFSCKKILV